MCANCVRSYAVEAFGATNATAVVSDTQAASIAEAINNANGEVVNA